MQQLMRMRGTSLSMREAGVLCPRLPKQSLVVRPPVRSHGLLMGDREEKRASMMTHAQAPSSGYGAAGTGNTYSRPSSEEQAKRARQLTELLQETLQISFQTGPRGFFRGLQAADAVLSLTREYLIKGTLDPPEVVLRK
ncbi:hypothetical protein DUNSADRAFT_10491 [Dunaliella salina]|uniref:Uncharacterized protein n=1 Tax=Dunaliella salina TaxID=3046 RepID=A0ABQ7GF69_DUNSA|nr:hypothetical protein DUNSADRAFT_10491 [Dunaliella salina]|eukprot:KAF5833253.1 hypothetical protein DUNSADRAFT_10491 [Dunaliella salina]